MKGGDGAGTVCRVLALGMGGKQPPSSSASETVTTDAQGRASMQDEPVQTFFSRLKSMFEWVPDWLIPLLLVILATFLALALHRALIRLAKEALGERSPFMPSLVTRTATATRLALVLLGVAAVLPTAPFLPEFEAAVGKVLVVTAIGLLGWVTIIGTNIAADLYVKQFDVEVADNLLARKHITQAQILKRVADTIIIIVTASVALMTFEPVRQVGFSLFASAGVAGLVVAFAARPLLTNLVAGVQIAMSQPIRIDDTVVVEGETGKIEEITNAYVVICLWDLRRLIVPLSYFIEKPFQNLTRQSAEIIGTVSIHADYTVPVEQVRQKLVEIVKDDPLWDGQVVKLHVTDAREGRLELRATVSAKTLEQEWDLCCSVREKLITYLQQEHPDSLLR
jgi:small-conductance mechanosensitive channel